MYFHECTLNRSILIHVPIYIVTNINRTFFICEKFAQKSRSVRREILEQMRPALYRYRLELRFNFKHLYYNSLLYIGMFYIGIPLFLYLVYKFDFVHSHFNSNSLDSHQN